LITPILNTGELSYIATDLHGSQEYLCEPVALTLPTEHTNIKLITASMNHHSTITSSTMQDEVLEGLSRAQKSLPSKYFYDERGSQLFEQITRLEEYYPTRTEIGIMRANMPDIISMIGSGVVLVELGSGSSYKTRLLLDQLPSITAYIPVEISQNFLADVVEQLNLEYPELTVHPLCTDYTRPFELPEINTNFSQTIMFYPGSTIGNFHPDRARRFLGTLSKTLNPGGSMLIGVDLIKDTDILEAAYNDRQGITAAFNKNILRHINQELGADFNLENYRHKAFYNQQEDRIEMHLVAEEKHEVSLAGEPFLFEEGESIHTENSYKYTLKKFKELVRPWFSVEKVWTDTNNYFSVQYLVKH